ncbi:hypothetical protein ACIBHY_31700 [Nonomuraea sp. NPDC050547]
MTRTLVLVIDNDVLLVAIPSLTQELADAAEHPVDHYHRLRRHRASPWWR